MKLLAIIGSLAVAAAVCAPAAQAVVLSCATQEYQEKKNNNGDSVGSNDKLIGKVFRIDTSDGWRTTDSQYLKSEALTGAGGAPLTITTSVDRESGRLEKTGDFKGASYTLIAKCKKAELKVNM